MENVLWIGAGLVIVAWGFVPEWVGWADREWFAANAKFRRRNAWIVGPLLVLFGLVRLLVA
jgi:hypothetical protein